jgi:hypothetical protein
LAKFFDNVHHFEQMSDRCLDMDPVSMTLALQGAQCTVCGDEVVEGHEQCDDGTANADEPTASCTAHCKFPGASDSSDAPPGALFFEDFESGLTQWRGKSNSVPETAVVGCDPSGQHSGDVMHITGCSAGGDAFSLPGFHCSLANPCFVAYDAKGNPWQGFSDGFPGNHIWTAGDDADVAAGGLHISTHHDTEDWHRVEYVFPAIKNFIHGDTSAEIVQVHFMAESATSDCDQTFFDNIQVTRATPEQVAYATMPHPRVAIDVENGEIVLSGAAAGVEMTIQGSPAIVDGPTGQPDALLFDKDGDWLRLLVGGHGVDIGSTWTVDCSFKTPIPQQEGKWHTLTRGTSGDGGDHQIIINNDDQTSLGTFDNGGRGFVDSGFDVTSVADGWHRLIVSQTAGTMSFYVDSALVGSVDCTSDTTIEAVGNVIGGGQPWGYMHRFRLYEEGLTPADLEAAKG